MWGRHKHFFAYTLYRECVARNSTVKRKSELKYSGGKGDILVMEYRCETIQILYEYMISCDLYC